MPETSREYFMYFPDEDQLPFVACEDVTLMEVPDELRNFDRQALERKARYLFDHPEKLGRRPNPWPWYVRLLNWLRPHASLRRKLRQLPDPSGV